MPKFHLDDKVLVGLVIGGCVVLVSLIVGCVKTLRSLFSEDTRYGSVPGGSQEADLEEQEREDILKEVYGAEDDDDEWGPSKDDPELNSAWEAIEKAQEQDPFADAWWKDEFSPSLYPSPEEAEELRRQRARAVANDNSGGSPNATRLGKTTSGVGRRDDSDSDPDRLEL
eukprot:gnl/TRDRNA2_/TRDRNA2_187074_c0_seq1.p1 gnl/TRDRNA2_/TRDRNA2_187074_c0~~gnl/TRDRNA2_/TRDRNA2_187074_c0_seq1.p1  ORF type:complete len:170 (-),score=42.74 gnl/TRDRNA2_/TRDRNA2_187074_c0_seq1:144-653(-)